MSTSYSTNLGLISITPGTEAGLWGGYTNTNICTLIEEAIGGYDTQAMADADTSISITGGASSKGRNASLKITGALTQLRVLTVPTVKKLYVINNATTGGFGVTVKTAAGTGVTVPNGKSMLLLVDGTNVVDAITYVSGYTVPTSATPTVKVGLTAVTGSPSTTTFIATDSAPALDVAITPTWTGAHIFSAAVTLNGTVSGTGLSSYLSTYLASPTAIGGTAAAAGTFTTLIAKQAYTTTYGIGNSSTAFTLNCTQSNVQTLTMTGNVASGGWTITSPGDGQTINLYITQGAGPYTLGWPTSFKWPGGVAGAISTTNGAVDLLVMSYRASTGFWYCTLSKAFA